MKKQIIGILPLFFLLFLLFLLFPFPGSSYAELSKQDLQEIRQLVREEIRAELAGVEAKIAGVNGEIAKLNLRIDELEKRVDAQIAALDSKVTTVQWTLNILIVIIVAILALPQAISFIRERRESQELAFLRQQILELQKRMESKV